MFDELGEFVVRGLAPRGDYCILVEPNSDAMMAFVPDVDLSKPEIVLAPMHGLVLAGRVESPLGEVERCGIEVSGTGWQLSASGSPFRIGGIPDANFRVRVLGRLHGKETSFDVPNVSIDEHVVLRVPAK